jgi:hypothetical protein
MFVVAAILAGLFASPGAEALSVCASSTTYVSMTPADGWFTTIQAAVQALPNPVAGQSCVMIEDSSTYGEQVTVQNFAMSGGSISIAADAGMAPVVNPPTGTAAFVIANASVSVLGIAIVPTSAIGYGIFASSAYVTISSVTVSDPNGNISAAGIAAAGWSSISYSSVSLQIVSDPSSIPGIALIGSAMTTISYSTVQTFGGRNTGGAISLDAASSSNTLAHNFAYTDLGVAEMIAGNGNSVALSTMISNGGNCYVPCPSLYVTGASNTVTQSYIDGALGALYNAGGASWNVLSQSTATSPYTFATVAYANGSSYNTISGGMITAPSGYGVYFDPSAVGNLVVRSTVTSAASGAGAYGDPYGAIYFRGASANIVSQSYLADALNPAAVFSDGAYGNTIMLSTAVGGSPGGDALYLTNATSNTLTGSRVASAGYGVYLDIGADVNVIALSTIAGGATGAGILVSSVNGTAILSDYIQGFSTSIFVTGSTGTAIGGSTMAGMSGAALDVTGGSAGLSLSSSVLMGSGSAAGVVLDAYNSGALVFSTDSLAGWRYGLLIGTQAAGAGLSAASLTFAGLAAGATAMNFTGGTFVSTFTAASFDASVGANVNASALSGGSSLTMAFASGAHSGSGYADDPGHFVLWPSTNSYPGCVLTESVGAGYEYPSISAAVAALPGSLPAGKSCVVIEDGGTYAEQVTVQNFAMNGSSIAIFGDPAKPAPTVNPPTGTAAFVISNASVSVKGINIAPTNPIVYGVFISSPYVQIGSVNVQDANGNISGAGVMTSSWTTVTCTSVTVGGTTTNGFWLPGSTMTTISFSSVQATGDNNYSGAILVDAGASSNVIARTFVNANSGIAVNIAAGANGNTISRSTMANSGGNCGYFPCPAYDVSGSSNTVIQSYLVGSAVAASFNGNANLISQSTMTTGASGVLALAFGAYSSNVLSGSMVIAQGGYGAGFITSTAGNEIVGSTIVMFSAGPCALGACAAILDYGSAGETVSNSYVQGSTAVYVTNGSAGLTIVASVLVATNTAGSALQMDGGSAGLTLSSSRLSAPASGAAVYLDVGDDGLIVLSTNALSGAQYGVFVATPAGTAQIWITSNTIVPAVTAANSTYGLYLDGLASGATIENNTIAYRTPGTMGGNSSFGLYAQASSGLQVDHNRINEPGMITGGTYYGAYLSDAVNSAFKFNDVSSTGPALSGAFLLRTGESSTNVRVKDNIFFSSFSAPGTGNSSGTVVVADAASEAGFAADYNDYFSSNSLLGFQWGAAGAQGLAQWRTASSQDAHAISANPLWFNAAACVEDFHPKSSAGRCPAARAYGTPCPAAYVGDGATSPTIDAADPNDNPAGAGATTGPNGLGTEPPTNGGLPNQGSTGQTYDASESPACAWINPPACGLVVNVSQQPVPQWCSAAYAKISWGVAASTTSAGVVGTNSCVIVRDTDTYNEAVAVRNFAFAHSTNTLTLMADPSFGNSAPSVNAPVGTAAFLIANASVNVTGINIAPANAISYGVLVSSANVSISSVNVLDAGGKISTAGIAASSWTTVSYSSVALGAPGAYGLFLSGASFDVLSGDYIQASTAVFVSGSTGTAIAGSVLIATNTNGQALELGAGSWGLSLTASTLIGGAKGSGLSMDVNSAGAINLSSDIVSGSAYGLNVAVLTGVVLAGSSMTFQSLTAGATAINFQGGLLVSTFTSVYFGGGGVAVNVNARALTAGSSVYILNPSGPGAGPAFDDDPNGRVVWPWPVAPAVGAVSTASITVVYGVTGALGYEVDASTSPVFAGTIFSSSTNKNLSALSPQGLSAATTYYLRAGALWGQTTYYNPAVLPALTSSPPPGSPLLSGIVTSSNAVRWAWTTAGGDANNFALFTSTGGLVVSLPASATFYLEGGLSTATAYSRYLEAANAAGQAFSSTAVVTMPHLGNVISGNSANTLTGSNGQVELSIPLSLLGGTTVWILSESPLLQPLMSNTVALISSAIPPAGLQESSASLREFIVSVNGARSSGALALPLTVSVPYTDAVNPGFVDGTAPPLPVSSLRLYVLDETTGLWTFVAGSSVDTTRKMVSGPIGHLSIFTAFGAAALPAGNLDSIRIYPMPYRPNSGNPDLGGGGTGIFFDQLPASASIKIYTISGQLVTAFDASSATGQARWDARNDKGRDAASGPYFAVISSPGSKTVTRKLLILR